MSAPRLRRRHDAQGFTLIEVLLVIVLIGILMGVAVVTLNPSDPARRLQQERERLQAQVQYARLLAESDLIEVGLHVHDGGYEFLRFNKARRLWEPLAGDVALKPRETPGISYRWRDAVVTPGIKTAKVEGNVLLPDMLLLSSGEATPGVITIGSQDDARVPALELNVTDLGDAWPAEDDRRAPR